VCYTPYLSHLRWFHHHNNMRWNVQVMKLLITQSSLASRHFLPLRSKYSQSMFFPYSDKPSFTPIQDSK
jgi:hypothetical protein